MYQQRCFYHELSQSTRPNVVVFVVVVVVVAAVVLVVVGTRLMRTLKMLGKLQNFKSAPSLIKLGLKLEA